MIADISVFSEVLKVTLPNFLKLLVMTFLVFYKLPQYIFPQDNIEDYLDKIVFNVLYMLISVVLIVALLLFLRIFSFITLILSFFLLKTFMVYYFEKKNYFVILQRKYQDGMVKVFNLLENFYRFQKFGKTYKDYTKLINIKALTSIQSLRILISILMLIYILYNMNVLNFLSLSYRSTDMPLYMEWVSLMKRNYLYANNLTIGAYFFGPPIIIFFLNAITNIDLNVLLNLYPSLFFMFLLIGIYYLMYKTTTSHYSALFAVIIFGLYTLSPLSTYLMGFVYRTDNPHILNFHGLSVYFDFYYSFPKKELIDYSYIPFIRINSGLPYEMAYSFYPLYIYFFIMTFVKKNLHMLLLYAITLCLVFTFHGGAALYLFVGSVLILINAFIFRKIDFNIFKKGIIAILVATLVGNLWVLSALKFGIPQNFGIAAPMLDKLFKTKREFQELQRGGLTNIFELVFYPIQLIFYFLLALLYPLTFFYKKNKRFILSSVSLAIISIILIYVHENLGFPRLVAKSRSCEYLLLVSGIGAGIYFNFFEKFINLILKKYSNIFLIFFLTSFFITSIFIVPTWNQTKTFFSSLDNIQYNAIVLDIYKIKKLRQPYSWTIVGYVQSYARVLDKGFHINTQTFIEKYNPLDKYLKVPTDWVYIMKETFPNSYRGSGEWFFRWKRDVELQLESWLNLYSKTHNNIRVFDERDFLTVYEIDNRAYTKYLYERKLKRDKLKSN